MPSSQLAMMQAAKKKYAALTSKGKGMDFGAVLLNQRDPGVTNIRNVKCKHWTRWLGVENRCVVPFTSFSEFNKYHVGDVWFALDETIGEKGKVLLTFFTEK